MKKSYLTLAAMAMIMASCSNEVLIDNEDGQTDVAIGFSTFSDLATKAAPSKTDLEFYHQSFSVLGTKTSKVDKKIQYIFGESATTAKPNYAVGDSVDFDSNKQAPNNWTYSPYRYWDKQAVYDFIAYAPKFAPIRLSYDGNVEVGNKKNTFVTSESYVLVGQNLQQDNVQTTEILKGFTGLDGNDCDIMLADSVINRDGTNHNDVVFSFHHILSKLNVIFAKSDILSNDTVVVKNVIISHLCDKGDYVDSLYKSPKTSSDSISGWTNVGKNNANYALKFNGNDTLAVAGKDTYHYLIESLVMPQQVTSKKDTIKIEYEITTGKAPKNHVEKFTYVMDLETAFKSFFDRYSYTLKFTIDPSVIKFDANAVVWDDQDAVSIKID